MSDRTRDPAAPEERAASLGARSLLSAALTRLRRRPRLLAPFLLAGVVGALADLVRFADPVPVQLQTFPHRGLAHVTLLVFPDGTRVAGLSPGTLLGLRPVYLAELAALWGVSVAASVAATALTVAGVAGLPWRDLHRERLLGLVGYALGVHVVTTLLVVVGSLHALAGLFAVLVVLGVVSRLFVCPPLVVLRGRSVPEAVRESYRRTPPNLSIPAFVLALGVVSYALASVPAFAPALSPVFGTVLSPVFGTVFSTALVGATYAAATVVALERV